MKKSVREWKIGKDCDNWKVLVGCGVDGIWMDIISDCYLELGLMVVLVLDIY